MFFPSQMNKNIFWTTLLFIVTLATAFIAGYITNDFIEMRKSDYPLLLEAIDLLEENALEPLPEAKALEYGMIRGLAQAYDDPYTIFLEPPQHEIQTNQLEGRYGGIGAKIELGASGYLLYPFPNGPAAEAGVINGDLLISVDELLITPETTRDQIEAALSGPVGDSVALVVSRLPDGQIPYHIQRQEVAWPSVIYHPVEGEPLVGLIQVNIIAGTTANEISTAVQNLQANGSKYFILDLRGNGGGLLNAGIETARLFLESGVVIEQQYRGKESERFLVTTPGSLANIPLVALVNHHTASAAEIIAGALQANARAPLVGEPTYGKDTIQLVFELQDGSSLHITSAHWWFPGLAFPVDGVGIKPDYGEGTNEVDWLQMAVNLLIQGQ